MSKNTLSPDVDDLYISFLLGIKEKKFILPIKSFKKLEAAGILLKNSYELNVVSEAFLGFYRYVRDRYGVTYLDSSEVLATNPLMQPDRAEIEVEQINEGYPWRHLLVVYEDLRMEKIVFHPDTFQKGNEEEDVG